MDLPPLVQKLKSIFQLSLFVCIVSIDFPPHSTWNNIRFSPSGWVWKFGQFHQPYISSPCKIANQPFCCNWPWMLVKQAFFNTDKLKPKTWVWEKKLKLMEAISSGQEKLKQGKNSIRIRPRLFLILLQKNFKISSFWMKIEILWDESLKIGGKLRQKIRGKLRQKNL